MKRILKKVSNKISNKRYNFSIDIANDNTLAGWVYDTKSGGVPVKVIVKSANKELLSVTSEQFRQDLKDAGVGTGHYAFHITDKQLVVKEPCLVDLFVGSTKLTDEPVLFGSETVSSSSNSEQGGLDQETKIAHEFAKLVNVELDGIKRQAEQINTKEGREPDSVSGVLSALMLKVAENNCRLATIENLLSKN